MSTLDALRAALGAEMSPARYAHILGVERAVADMAKLYCPEKEQMLRAAALLHDLTKEYTPAESEAVLAREGITLRPDERATPAVHHAITAPAEIARRYPAYATDELLSAVRWHTTGRADMTLSEALLYLADVIEEGRAYEACVALRKRFWGADIAAMDARARTEHLADVLLVSLCGVRESVMKKGGNVCLDTERAIACLTMKKPCFERKL